MKSHTIILGHGSRNLNTVGEFQETIKRYKKLYPTESVSYAFVEFSSPQLEDEIGTVLEKDEIDEIIIVPLFLSIGNHLTNHLPKRIEALKERYPDTKLLLARHIGADPLICNIIKVRSDEMKNR